MLAAALAAYPEAVAVHVVRDGRDVVTSLLERGWLSAERTGADDARLPFGAHPRFWVEPGRAEEFSRVSDATRAAWAWRRYVTAAGPSRSARFGCVTSSSSRTRRCRCAGGIGADAGAVGAAFAQAHDTSAGRWRRDLTRSSSPTSSARRAPRLVALGYELSGAPKPA